MGSIRQQQQPLLPAQPPAPTACFAFTQPRPMGSAGWISHVTSSAVAFYLSRTLAVVMEACAAAATGSRAQASPDRARVAPLLSGARAAAASRARRSEATRELPS